MNQDKIPATVLTGYLGAGKTTLLNRILNEPHGKKYAVIINEFGEVGIDNDLVVGADEEIFEMNNGCICCRVRGDLIRVLGNLVKRKGKFDAIIIETTGLADPGPVAQTFFVDDDIKANIRLDSIVTVVDARHLMQRLADTKEAEEQIAFADIILLNKTDLVTVSELALVEKRIHSINPYAKLIKSERCNVPLVDILDRGAFDLDRIVQIAPEFLEEHKEEHEHHCHDEHCTHEHHHYHHDSKLHDQTVGSVALTSDAPLDPIKFESWLSELVATEGPDLLRYKGILHLKGMDERFVVQGVHMIMEGRPTQNWAAGDPRQSRLVFIGRKLDEEKLRQGFADCRA